MNVKITNLSVVGLYVGMREVREHEVLHGV